MLVGLDLCAFIIALLALWYTIRESRRNNSVILRILECESAGCLSLNENDRQPFSYLRLVVRNEGVTLHDISVQLTFRNPEITEMSFTMCQSEERKLSQGEFTKGMIGEFFLKSYQLGDIGLKKLEGLNDPVKQQARFRVFSQDFLAKEIRIGSRLTKLKLKWNGLASIHGTRTKKRKLPLAKR
jgi:hypothetical protein